MAKALNYLFNDARKALVAAVVPAGVLAVALSDNVITSSEWIQIAIALAGVVGVHQVKNDPS